MSSALNLDPFRPLAAGGQVHFLNNATLNLVTTRYHEGFCHFDSKHQEVVSRI